MSQCICIRLWISLIFFMEVLKRYCLSWLTHKSFSLVCLWNRGTFKSSFWVSLQQVREKFVSLSVVFLLLALRHFAIFSVSASPVMGFRKQRAVWGVYKGNLTCKSSGFIPLSWQEQNIVSCNTEISCGCWKHAIFQMVASSFPKGRDANDCVHKCHKNKTQDVFFILSCLRIQFQGSEKSGHSLSFLGKCLQSLLVHRWLQGLALYFGSQN